MSFIFFSQRKCLAAMIAYNMFTYDVVPDDTSRLGEKK